MQQTIQPLASSFRDPSGFVFQKDNILYRQVNKFFKDDFDYFINSGCYQHLVKKRLLIPHEELTENLPGPPDGYKILRPERIPYIAYPYEWCFDMLKDAALLTLQLVKECIPFGVILKDASSYNVQWLDGKVIFIDTLSFEKYESLNPWIAYRQFCEHFLSPLLLMHYSKQSLQSLLLAYPEGIPLPITKSLLPGKSRFSFHTFLHIHLHEKLSLESRRKEPDQLPRFTEKKLLRLISSLESLINSLDWKSKRTIWENYYEEANKRADYIDKKKNIIRHWLIKLAPIKTAVDLGANQGNFSYLLAENNVQTIATDFDHAAINKLYERIKNDGEKNILPLVIDLSNPPAAIGLNNTERASFIERTKVDLGLALALVHHLAIGKNIPFEKIAELFEKITNYLFIEFVPKQDEKIQFMLRQKKDIYQDYTEENFVKEFEKHFSILEKQEIATSGRILYLLKKHG